MFTFLTLPFENTMSKNSDSTLADTRLSRFPDGFKMTGALLALSALAAPIAKSETAAVQKDKKKKADESTELPEMIVQADGKKIYKVEKLSSQKYTVPLRDVPQTVIAIPREVIDEQGATTLTEVLRNVPGITMNAGENGVGNVAGDTFFLRGFDGTNSLFQDGVRDDGVSSRDTYNVENVEVFLGPTGADVGRGNATGYINQSTKSPFATDAYAGSVSYASANRQRYTGDVNQTIPGLEGSAFRLNGLFQDGGVAGREEIERNSWGIAPSIAFGIGTSTRVILQYQHQEQDNIPDYGLPGNRGVLPDGVDREWFYGNPDYDYEDVVQDTYTLRLEQDINENITVRNQTRYNETSRETVATRPAYAAAAGVLPDRVTRTMIGGDRENTVLSNQTSISAKFDTGFLKHSLVGGFEYTNEEQKTYTLTGLGTYSGYLLLNQKPTGAPTGYNPTRDPDALSHGETETLGAYVFDTIEITPKWLLSGGARVDHYKTDYFTVNASNATTNPGVRTDYDAARDDVYSGKVGLTYKPVEVGSIYVAYGRTVTPPGTGAFTLSTAETNANNPENDPQISQNYEVGTKWDFFESKLTLTGSFFYTENTNVIYQDNPGETPATYAKDGGQQILGSTFSASGKVTENWSVIGSFTLLDATLDQPGALADGNDLARTPHFSSSLWTTYKLPAGFTVGAGYRYTGAVETSTAATAVEIPDYSVVDAMVQYDVNKNVNVRLNVFNVLNEEYVLSTGGSGGTARMNLGAPTSFMLSTNFKF